MSRLMKELKYPCSGLSLAHGNLDSCVPLHRELRLDSLPPLDEVLKTENLEGVLHPIQGTVTSLTQIWRITPAGSRRKELRRRTMSGISLTWSVVSLVDVHNLFARVFYSRQSFIGQRGCKTPHIMTDAQLGVYVHLGTAMMTNSNRWSHFCWPTHASLLSTPVLWKLE
jgi:hypothetical protein